MEWNLQVLLKWGAGGGIVCSRCTEGRAVAGDNIGPELDRTQVYCTAAAISIRVSLRIAFPAALTMWS